MTARTLSLLFAASAAMLVLAVSAGATTPGANGRIVFTSTRDGSAAWELYSAAADGSDAKRLTWSNFVTEQHPAWSPDGTRIAYDSSASGHSRIYVMNADGTGQTQISPAGVSTAEDSEPSWSPDGATLAFTSSRSFNPGLHIWLGNVDGTNFHQLTSDFSTDPSWSPDGSRIAYATTDSISVIGADGTGVQRVTTPPAGFTDQAPDWSPDGSTIVFARSDFTTTVSDLYAIAADGSGERKLTTGPLLSFLPSWSPDGTKILFERREVSGSFQLYELNADGSGVVPVATSAGNNLMPAWGTSAVSPNPSPPAAPQVQILSPTDGAMYLSGQSVPAAYLCSSYVSFVISCVGTVAVGGQVDTGSYGTKSLTVTATDLEGRQTVAVASYKVLDLTPPRIDVRAPVAGTQYTVGQRVFVDYSCSDEAGGSGIAFCSGAAPVGGLVDTGRVGSFTFVVGTIDVAGNPASVSVPYTVIAPTPPPDRTPPSVTIAAPVDGAAYVLGASVPAAYSCADETALATCIGTAPAGAPLDTATVGARVFTVTATDHAGNTATASRSYSVVYAFTGFFKPIAAYPAVTSADAGDDVELRFSLHGNHGSTVVTASAWTPCAGGASTAANGSLSYKSNGDLYLFRTATSRSWRGTCRDLSVTLDDGTVHRARLTFRR